ncbi:MAG: thioredoxin family protein [Leptospirales bacterium]|nr:thioredoxin family protein [Leptospirales bacterium]
MDSAPAARCIFPRLLLVVAMAGLSPLSLNSRPQDADGQIKEALEQAGRNQQPLMLDFYADWCGYCRRLVEDVYPNPVVREISVRFLQLRVNGDRFRAISRRYRVQGFPTQVFLNADGSEIDRIDGYLPAGEFARRLRQIYARSAAAASGLQNAGGASSPDDAAGLLARGETAFQRHEWQVAYDLFMQAHRRAEAGATTLRQEALFNAAVSSMQLDRDQQAVSLWSAYLALRPQGDHQHGLARLYRASSFHALGRSADARADLFVALRALRPGRERQQAEMLLADLH